MLRAAPQLASKSPAALRDKRDYIASKTGMAPEAVAQLCALQPSLLLCSPVSSASKLQVVARLLELPPAAVAEELLARPELLAMDFQRLGGGSGRVLRELRESLLASGGDQ